MDYTKKNPPDTNEGAAEVREPAVAYAYAPAGAVAGSDWEDDLDDGCGAESANAGGDWFDRLCREDPEFREALCRSLEETSRGRHRPSKEAFREFWQKIKNDTEADIAAGRIPPQPQEYWDELEQEIEKCRV